MSKYTKQVSKNAYEPPKKPYAHDNEKIERVSEINAKMQKWCDALDFITYIDTPSLIDKNMLKDGVHPKPENYSIFVDALDMTDIAIEEAK